MRAIATSIVAAVAWTAGTIVPASAETINVYDDHGGSVAEAASPNMTRAGPTWPIAA
jgi:hypothetical protein